MYSIAQLEFYSTIISHYLDKWPKQNLFCLFKCKGPRKGVKNCKFTRNFDFMGSFERRFHFEVCLCEKRLKGLLWTVNSWQLFSVENIVSRTEKSL